MFERSSSSLFSHSVRSSEKAWGVLHYVPAMGLLVPSFALEDFHHDAEVQHAALQRLPS